MGDTNDTAGGRGGHGLGFFAGFAPWIVYWILSGNVPFTTAILVALGLSVLINVLALVEHKPLMVLEVGNTVAFVGLALLGAIGGDAFVARWIQPLGNAALLAIMVVSVLIKKPFTLQYAKASTPPDLWDSPGFLYVNNLITWVWIAAMGVMTLMALIPPIVQGSATMNDGGSPLSIICYWVIPFTAMGLAIVFTVKFPDWFGAEFDDASADAPAAPPAEPIAVDGARPRADAGAVTLSVEPAEVLADQVPAIVVAGLDPGRPVALRTATVDLMGQRWQAEARLVADADGRVDTATTPAADGDWVGADATAPIWSMVAAGDAPEIYIPSPFPTGLTVTARVDDGPTLDATLVLRALPAGAHAEDVHDEGVVGRLFLPAGPGPFPGVVLFGGSEGGFDSQASNAALLAAHGHAALCAGYFGAPGLPDALVRIPLESLAAAIRWLAAHDAVQGPAVAAMAISRGSEALLSTLARVPDLPVRAAVAVSPSNVSWEAIGDDGSLPGVPSFTLGGAPVPYVAMRDDELLVEAARRALHDRGRHDAQHPHPMHLARAYAKSLDDHAGVAAAAIPSEAIAAPLLCLSGSDDQVWPSGPMAEALLARRSDLGRGDRHEHFEGAGHLLRLGLMPTTASASGGIELGGRPDAQAAAQMALTAQVLAFLDATR